MKLVVSEISSTFDNPESGTDALLQTVVCTDVSLKKHIRAYTDTYNLLQ